MRFVIGLLIVHAVLILKSFGQVRATVSPRIDCDSLYRSIKSFENSRPFSPALDSLFEAYSNSECFSDTARKSLLRSRDVIRIVTDYWRRDGYRIAEVDTLKKLDTRLYSQLYPNKISGYQLRIQTGGALNFSSIGSAGTSAGFMIGLHRQLDDTNIGISGGFFRQRLPFSVEVTNNKDDRNNFTPNGYVLSASGYVIFDSYPIILSYGAEDYEQGGTGFAFFMGAEIKKLRVENTVIKKYYFETDYRYISRQPSNINQITYRSFSEKDIAEESLFKANTYVNIVAGGSFSFYVIDNIKLMFSLGYSFSTQKLAFSPVDYAKGYSGVFGNLSCVFVLNIKKKKL